VPRISGDFDFSKQALLVLFVFIALFSWLLKIIFSRKVSINLNSVNIAVLGLFLASALSTVFSVDKYGSFWGWPRISADSMITITALAVFYFIFSSILAKKEIVRSINIFFVSVFFVEIIGIFKIFSFNTIGSLWGLGFFCASLIPLLFMFLIENKGKMKLFFGIELFFATIILFLVNYFVAWWVVVFGSFLILGVCLYKKDFCDRRWLFLPMFFLLMSFGMIIFNPRVNLFLQKYDELSLSQAQSFQIALQSLKNRPILGSGPGTFAYDFFKYRDPGSGSFSSQDIAFSLAGSKFLTNMATTGILGIVAFLALLDVVIISGIKLFSKKTFDPLLIGLFLFFLSQSLVFFLYSSSLSLDFIYFFTIAVFCGLMFKKRKEYNFSFSGFRKAGVIFVFLFITIFGLGVLFSGCQRYLAEINYSKGIVALNSKNIDKAILNFQTAANFSPRSDLYFRALAEADVLKLQNYLSNIGDKESLTDQEKKDIETLVSNSINTAKMATDLGANNVANWMSRGYVYQNLNGLIDTAQDWAINSYNKALELDPKNSDIPKIIEKIK
jgi:tetratricopeptide (TPR) repeat protein